MLYLPAEKRVSRLDKFPRCDAVSRDRSQITPAVNASDRSTFTQLGS